MAHRYEPAIRHRLAHIASPDVIGAVVEALNGLAPLLDECGFRVGDGPCVRPFGHEVDPGEETHVNIHGQRKLGDRAIRPPTLF